MSPFLALWAPRPLSLPVRLAGPLHVPFEGGSVSSHILSVVRRDQAGVVSLAGSLPHLPPCSLNPVHQPASALQEHNGFQFVPPRCRPAHNTVSLSSWLSSLAETSFSFLLLPTEHMVNFVG